LFAHRTWLPFPVILALALIPAATSRSLLLTGTVLVALGEAVRLWAVRHIGVISRTRSHRLGPLVQSGPFAYVRNPLYLGNMALWLGFTLSAGPLWLVPVVLGVLAGEYHAIVRWEETLLAGRLGPPYVDYMGRVPRWNFLSAAAHRRSTGSPVSGATARPLFTWRDTIFSERGTLAAIVVGYVLLLMKR
jgi:protein-S-isoprenylcysteine O-methyltransferase Ste14